MNYQFTIKSAFKRDVKGYKKDPAKEDIKDAILFLKEHPLAGELMEGNMSGVRNYHFYERPHKKGHYLRLLYIIKECCSTSPCDYSLTGSAEEISDKNNETQGMVESPLNGCEGVVTLVRLLTREQCNNIYYLPKKTVDEWFR